MVLILESRSHLDLGDLPNLLAAELGVMTVRLERAIRSLDGVARVHVNRWGDGSAHLHMWFLARPYGRLQLRGTFLSLWDSILPPISESQWRENLAHVAAWLAEFGGRPLAEPPRIQWQTPSSIAAQSSAEAAAAAAGEAVSVIESAEETPLPGPEESSADIVPEETSTAAQRSATVTPGAGGAQHTGTGEGDPLETDDHDIVGEPTVAATHQTDTADGTDPGAAAGRTDAAVTADPDGDRIDRTGAGAEDGDSRTGAGTGDIGVEGPAGIGTDHRLDSETGAEDDEERTVGSDPERR
ncbi:hypothetical protein OHQ87_24995 [Micromonospora sp. NBC_00421]